VLSVVIPTLNAAIHLPATLTALGDGPGEVLVIDGGSTDGTRQAAAAHGARVLLAPAGRGGQLATGVAAATQPWLLLLHADTRLGPGWAEAATTHMREAADRAAYFRFALDTNDPRARRLERLVAWRCRALAMPYGDQGLLLHRDLLRAVGGIRLLPLMEDVDLIRRLGRHRLIGLDIPATTSAAKWQHDGWYRRSARNLACLALYLAGLPPRLIARLY
jgi:rSAM/selenodomain-associated transferase 2